MRSARLHFFVGKGGVGKTTCAAATAVRLSSEGRRVLAISLDPAHSLADAFGLASAPEPRRLPGGQLTLHELDAAKALESWISTRKAALRAIAGRVSFLDGAQVSRLFEVAMPGADELMSLLEVARAADGGEYDDVVVDLAPTGHALRVLELPAKLDQLASALTTLVEGQHVVATALAGRVRAGLGELLVTELRTDAARLRALLRDPERSRFTWVTFAQPLSLAESKDGLRALRDAGLFVETIVVNTLTPAPREPCAACEARRAEELGAAETLSRAFPGPKIVRVARRRESPRGVASLEKFASALTRTSRPARPVRRARPPSNTRRRRAGSIVDALVPGSLRLLFVGGKGGVGKTTSAAGLALAIASRRPGLRVLLASADPAHSLADALDETFEEGRCAIVHRKVLLEARELDASSSYRARVEDLHEAVDELLSTREGAWSTDLPYERAALHELLALTPPGVDELAAILDLFEAIEKAPGEPGAYDLVVVDTAPTGHALQLLEAPRLVHEWAQALMRVLLESGQTRRAGRLAEELVDLASRCRRLRSVLRDPEKTRFLVVTRTDPLSRLESDRLLTRLGGLGVAPAGVLVNGTGSGDCAGCRRRSALDGKVVRAVAEQYGERPVLQAALLHETPRGPAALLSFVNTWEISSCPVSPA